MKNIWVMKKCSFGHRIGNIISSVIGTIDNLICILSLSFLNSNFLTGWIIYRLKDNSFFYDNGMNE